MYQPLIGTKLPFDEGLAKEPWDIRKDDQRVCACMLSRFSRVRLCDPMDYSPPGSSVHGILQARIVEWVAMPSSRGPSPPRDPTHVSCGSCNAGRFFTAEPPGKPQPKGFSFKRRWEASKTCHLLYTLARLACGRTHGCKHVHACTHTVLSIESNLSPNLNSVQIHLLCSRRHVRLFATAWTAAHQASLSFTISWSLHKLMSRFTCDASKNADTQALPIHTESELLELEQSPRLSRQRPGAAADRSGLETTTIEQHPQPPGPNAWWPEVEPM